MATEVFLKTHCRMSQAQRVFYLDYEYNAQSRIGTESTATNTVQNDKAFNEDSDLVKTGMQADVVAAMTQNLAD
jgi:hypothetical protein